MGNPASQQEVGLWVKKSSLRRMDARKRDVKFYRETILALVEAKGGDISPQERMLIEDISFLHTRAMRFKRDFFGSRERSPSTDPYLLRWIEAKARLLQTLGLQRVPREKELEALLSEDSSG